MSRVPAWILVMAVWAAIYLPALGSYEIQGEEGRRILPAMAMLQSGNYLVPHVGGDIYFSKPPLVNWLVAASIKLCGIRSEWTVRLPSVLAVLAVAISFVTVGRGGLGVRGATIAALIWLTTIGIIEKGRLVEIEGVYVSLSALGMICWLGWWMTDRSPWLTWVVPWIWLGLGWLAKGPVHLVFFYAIVVAVLWQTKQLKALLHPAHFVGIIIMVGIFAAWAIPFLQVSGQSRALTKWSGQFTGRITPHFFGMHSASSTLGRAVGQFLPWAIFAPLLRFSRYQPKERPLVKALAWSTALPLVVVSLLPVSAARYSLPVAAPFCWMMALGFTRDAFAPLPWFTSQSRNLWDTIGRWIVIITAVTTSIAYPIIAHRPNKREKVKSVAQEVNAVVPATETLYAIDAGYQPFLFYIGASVTYLDRPDQLPPAAHYFFVRSNREGEVANSEQNLRRHPVVLARVSDYRNETIVVFKVGDG